MKKNSTRNALISSVLMLTLCLSMFVGTTFAWFTDSVSSVNNVIKAGNLDVEMEYSTDGTTWVPVTEDESLFDANALWEPGHTEAVALKVKNAGTLALKFDLSTDVYQEEEGTNVYDAKFMLSDYLVTESIIMDNVPMGTALLGYYLGSRDANGLYADELGTTVQDSDQILEPGAEKYAVIRITMPTTVGNEANYKTGTKAPYIKFGVNLYATQVPYEEDSFGTDYDNEATYLELPKAGLSIDGPVDMTNEIFNSQSPATPAELDASYTFTTTETADEAANSPYKYWHADYVVTFDEDVAAGTAGLAGNYEGFDWIAFLVPDLEGDDTTPFEGVKANDPVRLLETAGITMNYEELCLLVEKFRCGVWDESGENAGTTITVELRMYETEGDPTDPSGSKNIETGKYVVINSTSYTF